MTCSDFVLYRDILMQHCTDLASTDVRECALDAVVAMTMRRDIKTRNKGADAKCVLETSRLLWQRARQLLEVGVSSFCILYRQLQITDRNNGNVNTALAGDCAREILTPIYRMLELNDINAKEFVDKEIGQLQLHIDELCGLFEQISNCDYSRLIFLSQRMMSEYFYYHKNTEHFSSLQCY